MTFKKTIIASLLVIINCAHLFSQNNGGFENWTVVNGKDEPDNWQTLNFLASFGNPKSAFKATSTDKYSGNYALKVKTVYLSNKLGINTMPDTIGIVFNGKIIISPPSYRIGSPYTTRSEKLGFYSKYVPVGSDTGLVIVTLHRNSSTGRDTIATGKVDIKPNGNYSFYEITLDYRSNATPDTAAIVFGSSKNNTIGRVGSELFVDDVLFTGLTPIGIKEYNNSYHAKIKTFPNPASDIITINTPFDEASKIELFDVSGKYINSYKVINYIVLINTNQYSNGVYFFNVYDKKNKLLTTGKFNVVK